MKKIIVLVLMSIGTYAQTAEVKVNMLNVIALGTVEIGAEYIINEGQSAELDVLFADRYNYRSRKSNKGNLEITSVQAAYNFYSGDNTDGFYMYPLLKYRFGTLTNNNVEEKISAWAIGMGGGYKYVHDSGMTASIFASINRGFNEEFNDRFSIVEFNSGIGLGYRF